MLQPHDVVVCCLLPNIVPRRCAHFIKLVIMHIGRFAGAGAFATGGVYTSTSTKIFSLGKYAIRIPSLCALSLIRCIRARTGILECL